MWLSRTWVCQVSRATQGFKACQPEVSGLSKTCRDSSEFSTVAHFHLLLVLSSTYSFLLSRIQLWSHNVVRLNIILSNAFLPKNDEEDEDETKRKKVYTQVWSGPQVCWPEASWPAQKRQYMTNKKKAKCPKGKYMTNEKAKCLKGKYMKKCSKIDPKMR